MLSGPEFMQRSKGVLTNYGPCMKWKERVDSLVLTEETGEHIFYDCSAESPNGAQESLLRS